MVEQKRSQAAARASGGGYASTFSGTHQRRYRRQYWLSQLKTAMASYIATCLILVVYCLLTWTHPNRDLMLMTELGALLFLVPLLYVLQYKIIDSPYRVHFFYFFTAATFPLVAWVWYLDGAGGSPTSWQFFLPFLYMALLFPPQAVLLFGLESIFCYLSVGLFTAGSAFSVGFLVQPAMLCVCVLMAVTAARGRQVNDRERRRLATRLQEMASTDMLTGCLNHGAFMDAVQENLKRAARRDDVLSLLVIDVDHFKYINDHHGHPVGDEVLRRTGEVLRRVSRRDDTVGRPGGDEFALLAPGTDGASACKLAERVRGLMAGPEMPFPVEISVGVSCLRAATPQAEDIFQTADQALYRAKRLGRNRVELMDMTVGSHPAVT